MSAIVRRLEIERQIAVIPRTADGRRRFLINPDVGHARARSYRSRIYVWRVAVEEQARTALCVVARYDTAYRFQCGCHKSTFFSFVFCFSNAGTKTNDLARS